MAMLCGPAAKSACSRSIRARCRHSNLLQSPTRARHKSASDLRRIRVMEIQASPYHHVDDAEDRCVSADLQRQRGLAPGIAVLAAILTLQVPVPGDAFLPLLQVCHTASISFSNPRSG